MAKTRYRLSFFYILALTLYEFLSTNQYVCYNIFINFKKGGFKNIFMDGNQAKKTPIKDFAQNINANKNMFITKIKILKQLKNNGNNVNLDTIQRVFNINIINIDKNKTESKSKTNKNINFDTFYDTEEESKEKNKFLPKTLFNKKKLIFSSFLVVLLFVNFIASILFFNLSYNIEYNELTEQLSAIIYRSLESPQTDICLKSRYDENSNSIVYYYEVIDHLDSYTYYIKNTSLDNELRVKLLTKIANTSKKLENIKSIDYKTINSISLVGHSYIIDNKYSINEDKITGKDINIITSSIKQNSINKYNNDKRNFMISSYITIITIEGFIVLIINKNKKMQQ